MQTAQTATRRDYLTFKGNLQQSRHGWLRLTPAYSVHLVTELLNTHAQRAGAILDPFCGTGTTALVCAEQGRACTTTDINPFLVWFSQAKTYNYTAEDQAVFSWAAEQVAARLRKPPPGAPWAPPLHQIEKWWEPETLGTLGHLFNQIQDLAESVSAAVIDLLKIAFCRVMLEQSNASFGHQSMSFKKGANGPMLSLFYAPVDWVADNWRQAVSLIAATMDTPVKTQPHILAGDARQLAAILPPDHYACVITSPPYPNRVSYIRELRPYMYWLGYLNDGRAAGELDWEAIGGTWGCATSNLARWRPAADLAVPFQEFAGLLSKIAERSPVLAQYVRKYFQDMLVHSRELFRVVQPGGSIHYIIGNSKFYDVLLPVELIYAAIFQQAGFADLDIQIIRKRTSKKELFEFLVSARKPA